MNISTGLGEENDAQSDIIRVWELSGYGFEKQQKWTEYIEFMRTPTQHEIIFEIYILNNQLYISVFLLAVFLEK